MQICLLHLDGALKSQTSFMVTCEKDNAQQIEATKVGSSIRLWGKHEDFEPLRVKIDEHFASVNEPQLVFMGSGDFHHATSLLLAATLKKLDEPITVIHFDNHPDWVKFKKGIHCGSWVNKAISYPQVAKIITIGVCSDDLRNPEWKGGNLSLLENGSLEIFPYRQKDKSTYWRTIEEIGEQEFVKIMLSRIQTKSVYITIDKDVLANEDASTNWDQGVMRLPYLLQMVREIGKNHTIIGADVNGDYSPPQYSGNMWTRFLKKAEILIDQPHKKPDIVAAAALDSATNHAILEVLSEVMA